MYFDILKSYLSLLQNVVDIFIFSCQNILLIPLKHLHRPRPLEIFLEKLTRSYRDAIIQIAKDQGADAIIPGYGFLSENSDFARATATAGMVFVGPSPECIDSFGLKHTARRLAEKAGVPIVPGTKDLIQDEQDAIRECDRLGFPVMLKATAGGGGMGLAICHNDDEVKQSFATVRSRGENLFKNAGIFVERYYPDSHHIEVQVFGNGLGKAIHVRFMRKILGLKFTKKHQVR